MISEKNFSINPEDEQEQAIIIKKSSEAPQEIKENPFYDSEFWARANSPDDIYLPDSDEAISFAIAAHEIGHLIEEGKRDDARLDNFEATLAEEKRAWDKGWEYLKKYALEYYKDSPETFLKIQKAFDRIRGLLIQAVNLSKEMYLEKGILDNLNNKEVKKITKEKRENFFSEKGEEFKQLFEKVKKEKIGVKPDWDKFVVIVKKAVEDVIKYN
ncbi:MAG: hypothetical protein ABIA02_03775 [Candidatus Falkowbacteria bacterium]